MIMAYSNTRGGFYNNTTGTELSVTSSSSKILDEHTSLKAGLFRQAVPFLSSDLSIMTSLYGRVRVLVIRGVKFGTQLQMEAFVKQFTDHINISGSQQALRYYPLVHPDHTSGEGTQTSFYEVLINDFTYSLSERDAGLILEWEIEVFEGTKVL